MPLLQATLQQEILKLTDPDQGAVYPDTLEAAADNWATAFTNYILGALNPPQAALAPGLTLAEEAFKSAFITAATVNQALMVGVGVNPLEPAATAYITTLADNVTPGVAAPPTSALVIPVALFDAYEPAAAAIAAPVDAWVKTATYTVGPPPPPTDWS